MTNRLIRSSGPPGTVLANTGRKQGNAAFVSIRKLIQQYLGNTVTTTGIKGGSGITVTPTGPGQVTITNNYPPGMIFSGEGESGVGEPGPPGAAGTAGATGATGATGPMGVPGQDGEDGGDQIIQIVQNSSGSTSFANPTATASDTAVNGTATTAMRSDAAPAIQKASSSQYGVVKPDGTTIVDNGSGVLSGAGGGSAGAWTSIVNTFVQSKTTATTSAINTTGANLIVAVAAAASGAVQPYTVTDNKSNTYTARTAFTGTSFTLAQIFYCINPTVGSGHTFTLTANGGGNPLATFLVWAFSWSGVSISYIAENGVGGANTSLTTIQTGIVNPAAAASYLAISGLCIPTTGTGSATTSWNPAIGAAFSSGNFNGGWMSWKITGSTDSALWTWTGSSGAATTIALFKGA